MRPVLTAPKKPLRCAGISFEIQVDGKPDGSCLAQAHLLLHFYPYSLETHLCMHHGHDCSLLYIKPSPLPPPFFSIVVLQEFLRNHTLPSACWQAVAKQGKDKAWRFFLFFFHYGQARKQRKKRARNEEKRREGRDGRGTRMSCGGCLALLFFPAGFRRPGARDHEL